MGDGVRLQAVELIEGVVPHCVADEVEDVFGARRGVTLCLVGKGAAAREAVVCLPDQAGVGEGFAKEVGGEAGGKVFEGAELWADVDGCRRRLRRRVGGVVVENYGENGLGAAGVLDGLAGEEEAVVVDGGRGIGAILWGIRVGRCRADVFEEEDDAIDGTANRRRNGVSDAMS